MTIQLRQPPYSVVQSRTITVALRLFGEHGVKGTSLQMIADALGVTKAAVYHQFKTKAEIVMAVAELELSRLDAALDAVDADDRSIEAREALLRLVIAMAVQRRGVVSALQSDTDMVASLVGHEPFQLLMDRLFKALLGDETGAWPKMQAAVLSAAIGGAVVHPYVADLDDESLTNELLPILKQLIVVPD